jgi:hypothetical protein
VTDPGPVNLDAEEVPLGMGRGQRDQCLAVAEADLERDGASRPKIAGRSSGHPRLDEPGQSSARRVARAMARRTTKPRITVAAVGACVVFIVVWRHARQRAKVRFGEQATSWRRCAGEHRWLIPQAYFGTSATRRPP